MTERLFHFERPARVDVLVGGETMLRRVLPHLRADGCESCRRYIITVDLRKDAEAVPIVDELVALPLDLYVQERGFAKITPNLMAIG